MLSSLFIIQQIIEKEYSSAGLCFFYSSTKGFWYNIIIDVLTIVECKHTDRCMKNYQGTLHSTEIKMRSNGEILQPIKAGKGIRQGDSLSPLLLKIIMDKTFYQSGI